MELRMRDMDHRAIVCLGEMDYAATNKIPFLFRFHDPAWHLPGMRTVQLQEGQERRTRHQALLPLAGCPIQSYRRLWSRSSLIPSLPVLFYYTYVQSPCGGQQQQVKLLELFRRITKYTYIICMCFAHVGLMPEQGSYF